MAFVRRKGNAFYRVRNARRGGELRQLPLADRYSPVVQKLISPLRAPNLDLADLFPPLFRISDSPGMAEEILIQLRLLHFTIQVKLIPFDQGHARFSGNLSWDSRLARRRP